MTVYSDDFTLEALHTTLVLQSAFDPHVMGSRCAQEFPDVQAAAEDISRRMGELYQLIGTKFGAQSWAQNAQNERGFGPQKATLHDTNGEKSQQNETEMRET